MAQFVGRAVDGQSGLQQIGFEPPFDGARRELFATLVSEERPMVAAIGDSDRLADLQIFPQRLLRIASHDADAFFSAFPSNSEVLGNKVDVFKFKIGGLADSQARAVDDLQNGRVPRGKKLAFAATVRLALQIGLLFGPICFGCFQKSFHLFDIEKDRQAAAAARAFHLAERIAFHGAFPHEKTEERPHAGHLAVDRRPRQALRRQLHGEMLRMADGDGFPIACAVGRDVRRKMQEMRNIHEVVLHGVFAVAFLRPQKADETCHLFVFAEQVAFCGEIQFLVVFAGRKGHIRTKGTKGTD